MSWAVPSSAQSRDRGGEKASRGGFVVVGVASLPEFEGADDGRTVPFVVGRGEIAGFEFEAEGLSARLDIWDHPVWRAGPLVSLTLPRDDDFVDEPTVQRLEEVDLAVELGGFVGFRQPLGRTPEDALSGLLAIRQDVLDAHGGFLISAELEYFFKISRMFRLGIAVNATWADGSFHETYFGVSELDAGRSGLALFDAEAGVKDFGVEIYNITSFSESWGVFTRVAYNRLLGDASDSPIVTELGSRDQIFAGMGVFYRW